MQNWSGILPDETWVMAKRLVSASVQEAPEVGAFSTPLSSLNEILPVALVIADEDQALGRCQRCQSASRLLESSPLLVFVGEPLDSASQELLNKMITAMGVRREQALVLSLSQCDSPRASQPHADLCPRFVQRELAQLAPRRAITLGKAATQAVLATEQPISGLRGRFQTHPALGGIEVMPTFQPSYLIKNPAAKADAWKDLLQVCQALGLKPANASVRSQSEPQKDIQQ